MTDPTDRPSADAVAPTLTDVLLAYRFLKDRVTRTPFEHSPALSDASGAEVFVKWENQQLCRSFKIRGALNKMYSLSEEERARGVVTASSGNHAQGVATAAALLKVRARIYVPQGCPQVKREAIRRRGGEFVELTVFGDCYDRAEEEALRVCRAEGRTFVSAYEDRQVAAGQGTVGVEMLLDQPDLDAIVCPISGGGLISGITAAARGLRPGIEIRGSHAAAHPTWPEAFRAGRVVPVTEADSVADALAGSASQPLFEFLRDRLTGLDACSEEEIEGAVAFVHREQHQVIEGGAAVGVASILSGRLPLAGKKVGLVVSGGNIDEARLLRILGTAR
jgi:threonine dehydratase